MTPTAFRYDEVPWHVPIDPWKRKACDIKTKPCVWLDYPGQHFKIAVVQDCLRTSVTRCPWHEWLCQTSNSQLLLSSFPIIHKVCNVGIFVLLIFENKMNREINDFNYISKHYGKCRSALKLIRLLTVYNLFPLEVVQNANFGNFMYCG